MYVKLKKIIEKDKNVGQAERNVTPPSSTFWFEEFWNELKLKQALMNCSLYHAFRKQGEFFISCWPYGAINLIPQSSCARQFPEAVFFIRKLSNAQHPFTHCLSLSLLCLSLAFDCPVGYQQLLNTAQLQNRRECLNNSCSLESRCR